MLYKKYFYLIGKVLVGVVVLLVTVNLVLITINKLNFWPRVVDDNTYQAVFLDNNQIYFGHLKNTGSSYPSLTDVYYIQLNDSHAGKAGRLVKLGETESHGPKNKMTLNKEHILFWEDLRSDSPVVRAIQSVNAQK